MDDLSPAELREVKKAIKTAYERGRMAERKEFDAFLSRMRTLKELNGSGDAFLKAWEESKHPRDHGKFSSAPGGKGGDDGAADKKPKGDAAAPARPGKLSPADPTQEDWVPAPGPRSKNRWLNTYTGKVAYGAKPPKGRTPREREAAVAERAARLKEPARFAGGEFGAELVRQWESHTGIPAADTLAVVDGARGAVAVPHMTTAGKDVLAVDISHPDTTQWTRKLILNDDGSMVLSNQAFFIRPNAQGSGFGTEAFAAQVRGCVGAGVAKIVTCAGRGSYNGAPMNGYYTWPLLGYDAPLTGAQKKKLPPDLRGAETVQDLYATPAGKAWWKENGVTTAMEFDVSPGSRSLAVLNAYLAGRGKGPVEYSADQHERNAERQRARVAARSRSDAAARKQLAHAENAERARAAGYDPAEIRSLAGSYPAAETPSLDAAYTRAMQEAGERRFARRWESETAARDAGRAFAERYGVPPAEAEALAVRLAARDSDILHDPDGEYAVRSAIISAVQSLHYDRAQREGSVGGK